MAAIRTSFAQKIAIMLSVLAFSSSIVILSVVFMPFDNRSCEIPLESVLFGPINNSTLTNGNVPKLEDNKSLDISKDGLPPRRKGLIIVAAGRSGSSFTLDLFNENDLVFATYEPLLHTERWKTANKSFNQSEAVLDLVTAFMTCSFSKNKHAIKFLKEFSTQWDQRFVSNVFSSPPFCKGTRKRQKELCSELVPELVDKECLKKNYSVIKVIYTRLPDWNINVFQPAVLRLKKEMDLRIVHLVRDPRGNIHTRIRTGWVKEYPSTKLTAQSREVCDLILNNMIVGEKFNEEMKRNYMLVKYDDISKDIIKGAQKLYKFAEMETTPVLLNWIKQHVQLERVQKWRTTAPDGRIKVIEKECRPLLTWLDIKPIKLDTLTMFSLKIVLEQLDYQARNQSN